VDIPYAPVDAALEAYVIYFRDGHQIADFSRMYQLAVPRSFFETVNRRKIFSPAQDLDEVSVYQRAPKQSHPPPPLKLESVLARALWPLWPENTPTRYFHWRRLADPRPDAGRPR
jgi:hypothetical protein